MGLRYTTNYNFALAANSAADIGSLSFLEWRDKLDGYSAGANDSNFEKLDACLFAMNESINRLGSAQPVYAVVANAPVNGVFTGTNTSVTSYYEGLSIVVGFSENVSGTTAINISGLGNKTLKKYDAIGSEIDLEEGDLVAGKRYFFIYHGSYFDLVGDCGRADEIRIAGTAANFVGISANGTLVDSLIASSNVLSYKGYYATFELLQAAYPTGENGYYAIVAGALYTWVAGTGWSPASGSAQANTYVEAAQGS